MRKTAFSQPYNLGLPVLGILNVRPRYHHRLVGTDIEVLLNR